MQKTSLVLPYEFEIVFQSLPLEQAGMLILAIYDYEQRNVLPDFADNPMLMFAWNTHIKPKIDENVAKYQEVCEKRKASGNKGGRPKKQNDDEKPNGFEENQMVFEKAKEPDGDGDGDCDGELDIKENSLKEKTKSFSAEGLEVIKLYEERFGIVSSYKATQLNDLVTDFGKDAVAYAVRQANISSAPGIKYIRTTAMNFVSKVQDGTVTSQPHYGKGSVV